MADQRLDEFLQSGLRVVIDPRLISLRWFSGAPGPKNQQLADVFKLRQSPTGPALTGHNQPIPSVIHALGQFRIFLQNGGSLVVLTTRYLKLQAVQQLIEA
jgi:hypothetical protein